MFWAFWIMLTCFILNCNSLQKQDKWKKVWNLTCNNGAELITFQETYLTSKLEKSFGLFAQAFDIFYSHGMSQSAGILVAVKRNLGFTVLKTQNIQGYALCLDFNSQSEGFRVIAIYAPPDRHQCQSFFDTIATWILPGQTYILGDFNSVTDPVDRVSGKLDVTSSLLYDLLTSNELLEPPSRRTFTYQHPSAANRKSRINRIYIPLGTSDHILPIHSGANVLITCQ